ncbi:MAG: hypothetical protein LQ351_000269 [Letrouitia transgressa]|nr:MAG: hypothetical protein LQ351_000269 [Letrouitia transgressa]
MADIYRNGLCNIAASRAANSHGGFFAKGDLALFEPPAVVPKWEGCSGMQYELCHLDSFGAQYRKQPLHCRAWYVQEHILGPRQISFAGQELLWHCRERTASEIWPTSVPYIVNDSTVHLFGASFPHNNSSFQELFEDWRAILNEYSMSALTRPEDKLVAISGIVRIIQQATGMSYWAGIWDHDLTRQLLWAANGNNVRPQQYRAPSWSWASLDGKIDSGWNHGGDTLTAWSRQSIVQFLEIKVTPVHQDMTGQISAAFIRLRGPLFQVLSFDNKREHATVSILSKYYAYTDVHFDTAEQFSATDLLCLPLRKEPRSRTDSGIAGLIVLNRGRLNEYERLGTFKLMSEEAYRALGLDQQNPGLDSTTPNVENYDIVLV